VDRKWCNRRRRSESDSFVKRSYTHSFRRKKRIEKFGGKVEDGRVVGVLGVSRSFGDAKLKKMGVISQPDITKFTITPADRFIILACDGLFSVMSESDVTDFIQKSILEEKLFQKEHPYIPVDLASKQRTETESEIIAKKVTRKLVREAVLVHGAKDNVTVIVILFDHSTVQPIVI